ncbi:hypothetical protein [Pacificibacter sp. AS14]|uniref:hypothetical protein n=1 Tax=Pacificibacter sp. AS14 TaxID=3135785 RepID=UPI003173E83E
MSDNLIKIQQLQSLAELKLNTERARLKGIAREEDGPNAVLQEILQEKQHYGNMFGAEVAQSTRAGMDGKWRVWAERKTLAAMLELARIAKKREDQLLVTNQAFGRTEALKAIVKKAKEAQKK